MIRIMSKTRGAVSLYITKRGHGLLRINHSTSIVSTVSKQISKEELFSTAPRTLAQHLPTMIPLQPVAYPTEDNGVAGRSLLASHFIPKGVEIMAETFRAGSKHIQKQPSRFSLRKEDGVHLVVESIIRFTNHSFSPNAQILFPSTSTTTDNATSNRHHRIVLQSVTSIEVGKEITIDYTQTEMVMAEPFMDIKTGKRVGTNRVEEEA